MCCDQGWQPRPLPAHQQGVKAYSIRDAAHPGAVVVRAPPPHSWRWSNNGPTPMDGVATDGGLPAAAAAAVPLGYCGNYHGRDGAGHPRADVLDNRGAPGGFCGLLVRRVNRGRRRRHLAAPVPPGLNGRGALHWCTDTAAARAPGFGRG